MTSFEYVFDRSVEMGRRKDVGHRVRRWPPVVVIAAIVGQLCVNSQQTSGWLLKRAYSNGVCP
mgnify:CR=1 FL=1